MASAKDQWSESEWIPEDVLTKESRAYNGEPIVDQNRTVRFKNQDRPPQVSRASSQRSNQNANKFTSADLRKHMDKENEALIAVRKIKQRIAEEEEERKYAQKVPTRQEEADREKAIQKQIDTYSTAQYQVRQMTDRHMVAQEEKLQERKYREMLRDLDEQYLKEQKLKLERKSEAKKALLKAQREDLSRRNLIRERDFEALKTEEQRTMLCDLEREEIMLQRKAEKMKKFTMLQIPRQKAVDSMAAMMKDRSCSSSQRTEQSYADYLAHKDAENMRQQRLKGEKTAAMLRSIADHRQQKLREYEQQRRDEDQRNRDLLKALKDADTSFLANQKAKAQKNREELRKIQKFNATLASEQRDRLQQLKWGEREAAVRNASEQTFGGSSSAYNLRNNAEHLWSQQRRELQRLLLSLNEGQGPSGAARDASAAKDATRKGYSSLEGSNFLSADKSTPLPRYSRDRQGSKKKL